MGLKWPVAFFEGPLLVCPTERLPSSGALTFTENERGGLSRRASDSQRLNYSSGLESALSTTSLGLTSAYDTRQDLPGSSTCGIFSSAVFLRPLRSPPPSPLVCSLRRWSEPITHLHLSPSSQSFIPIHYTSSHTQKAAPLVVLTGLLTGTFIHTYNSNHAGTIRLYFLVLFPSSLPVFFTSSSAPAHKVLATDIQMTMHWI